MPQRAPRMEHSTLTGSAAVIPGPNFSPKVAQRDERLAVGLPQGSEGEESGGGRAHWTHGGSEPFPASSFQVERSEGVCFCNPEGREGGGGGRLSGDIPSWSHTRWSTADLSSRTAARSWEADRASFPTSVVGAIVGALSCAFLSCFSSHLLSSPLPPPSPSLLDGLSERGNTTTG